MDGVIREKDGLQHLGRRFAIYQQPRFDRLLQADGLFHCDQGADSDVGQALDGLDDDFDILALFVGGREERQVAQLGQHPAQFGLKNHQHRQNEERGESP